MKSGLDQCRDAAARSLAQRQKLLTQLARDSAALAAAREQLRQLQAAGNLAEAQDADARIRNLVNRRVARSHQLADHDENVRRNLAELLSTQLRLEADAPLALLPVRVETRSTPDRTQLRIRIFHDIIHTESLDEGLSAAERSAGITYWTSIWSEPDLFTPWQALVTAVGVDRAPWAAMALRPNNIGDRPNGVPVFPDTPDRSGRPAVARTLPDRFYVRVEQDGVPPHTEHGELIPDELPVGLTDRDTLTALKIDGHDLPPIDESLRWLVDYDEALRVGMAVTVTLPRPGRPVRHLLVYGVRATLDAAAGAARLQRLIQSHRFTDGAAFVAQGTPTNNTDTDRPDWSKRTPPQTPMSTTNPPRPGTNAATTAAALDIDAGLLSTLSRADAAEQANAAAFNTALWTTTWGDAIEHLTPQGRANGDKRLDNRALDAVREHWVRHVRARGPLPALRLGKQPYGLLPIVATDSSWQPHDGSFVENRLIPFLSQHVRWMWDDAITTVATVMNRDLDEALQTILGTDAVLQGLRVRTALTPDLFIKEATALTLPNLANTASGQQISQVLLLLSGVPEDALDDHHLLGTKTRALALPLVHDSDITFVADLLSPDPQGTPQSVLQVLLAHAAAVQRHNRAVKAPIEMYETFRAVISESRVDFDRDMVAQALDVVLQHREVSDPIAEHAAAHIAERVGRLDARIVADRNPIHALAPHTTIQQIAGQQPKLSLLTGRLGMQSIGEIFQQANWESRFRAALHTISTIESLDERRLLLAETLDCCSHRLDAWITAAATRRLNNLRDDGARGTYLGAYAWLENIELRTPSDAGQIDGHDALQDACDGGYIHAPGLLQAATAGVLRSGRLTHHSDPGQDPFDIDLSSTRTRDALALLEGMRRGQSLGALLGYRLERRLHERSAEEEELELDRFIYVLRTLAPLRGGKLTEPGAPVQESVAASEVVDGLRLMEIPAATVANKLHVGPEDYLTYIDHWDPPTDDERNAVLAAIKELRQTHDAVADLLLAESVHQLVSGDSERAAAVLDTLGGGEAVPPDPDVVRTPGTGVPVQHRVAVLVPQPLAQPVSGWDPFSPRALAEPNVEAWAQRALGDPAATHITPDRPLTLAYAGLSALDVLYDADGDNVADSTLVRRLRDRFTDQGELGQDFTPLQDTWELAAMLRAMLLSGRPLDASDLGGPLDSDAIGRVPDIADLLARATWATEALKAAAATANPSSLLARFGVRTLPGATTNTVLAEARTRIQAAEALLAQVTEDGPTRTNVELASGAITTVFGSGFVTVPVLLPPPAGETDLWTAAVGPTGVRARPGADIRTWLARAGAVRANTAAYGETLLVREAFGQRPRLRVMQSPTGAHPIWVGLPFPDGQPPMTPLSSMVAEIVGAPADRPEPPLGGALAGFVVDEWTEALARWTKRGDPADPDHEPELVQVTTTGIALNANAPGARPPQSILLALSADGADWDEDRIVKVLDDTFALAKMRMVTLQQLPFVGRWLPALYFRDWSLQGEPVIDWVKVATKYDDKNIMDFLQVDQ